MRERRVAALAAPFPAARANKCAVRAVDLQCHRRHEGPVSPVPVLPRASNVCLRNWPTSPSASGKWPVARVAVIGGDDQPPPGGEALDESPEVIAGQLLGHVLVSMAPAPACTGAVVQAASGQWCQKIWFGALPIRLPQSFHGKSTVSVLAACSLCARPPPLFWSLLRLGEAERGQASVSPGSSDARQRPHAVKAALLRALQQPRQFAQERPSRISTALALKGSAHQRVRRSDVRSTLSPNACHKSQPLERNRSSAPISRSRRTTSLGALPAASGFLAISTGLMMTPSIGVGAAVRACKALAVRRHQSSSFSRLSSKVMPSGRF